MQMIILTEMILMKKLLSCTKKVLRKFHTNDPNFQTIKKMEKFQPLEVNLKVLGIYWHKQNEFYY